MKAASHRSPDVPVSARCRDEGFPRSRRLVRSRMFQEAYAQGVRYVGRHMVLWLRCAEDAALRVGVVASRKVGNAVARNRAKRRLREVFRRNRARLCAERTDVVLVARAPVVTADWQAIETEFLALTRRAGLRRGAE